MFAVPICEDIQRLSDDEGGALLTELSRGGGQRVAQTQPGKPKLRLAGWPEWCAGQPGELFLRGACGRAADLLAVNQQEFAGVVLLQDEGASIRECDFG